MNAIAKVLVGAEALDIPLVALELFGFSQHVLAAGLLWHKSATGAGNDRH